MSYLCEHFKQHISFEISFLGTFFGTFYLQKRILMLIKHVFLPMDPMWIQLHKFCVAISPFRVNKKPAAGFARLSCMIVDRNFKKS